MGLFRTIPQADYSTLDERVWAHPGPVVDLGCDPWDWSAIFVGKKRLIGADPFASEIPGTELYKGVIGTAQGNTTITRQGDSSNILFPGPQSVPTPMCTWRDFLKTYQIDQIAALKINIEGSEYALLHGMDEEDFSKIDQIAVSFHHFVWPAFRSATDEALARLRHIGGYTEIKSINQPWCWYLCTR